MLNDASEQLGRDVELFVGILREELVFLKQVLDHAVEHILLPLDARRLKPLKQLKDVIDGNLVRRLVIYTLEVSIGLVLDLA